MPFSDYEALAIKFNPPPPIKPLTVAESPPENGPFNPVLREPIKEVILKRMADLPIPIYSGGYRGVPDAEEVVRTEELKIELDVEIPREHMHEIREKLSVAEHVRANQEDLRTHFIGAPVTPNTVHHVNAVHKSLSRRIEEQFQVDPDALYADVQPPPMGIVTGQVPPTPEPVRAKDIVGVDGLISLPVGPSPEYRWIINNQQGEANDQYTLQLGTIQTTMPTYSWNDIRINGEAIAASYIGWDGGTAAGTSITTGTAARYQYEQQRYKHQRTAIQYGYATVGQTASTWVTLGSGTWSTGAAGNGNINIGYNYFREETKTEKLKSRIRRQLSGDARRRIALLSAGISAAELKARDTLRDMISEAEWRRYITNSFVMVRGASGRQYQVFSDHNRRIQVWEKGKHIANLCIHTHNECPPSDHVISMKILIEFDENALWQDANVHNVAGRIATNPDGTLATVNQINLNAVLGDGFFADTLNVAVGGNVAGGIIIGGVA